MFDEVPDVDSTPERTIVDLRGHGPIVTVGRYRHLAAKEALEPQRHRSWVVIVIPLKAHLDVLVDGRRWEVGPSQVMRIAPGQTYVTGATGQPRGQLVWLIGHVGGGGDPLNRALTSLAGAGPAVWQAPDQATASLQAALDDPGDTGWVATARRRLLCGLALLDLVQARDRCTRVSGRAVQPGVRAALRWTAEHLEEPIGATDLLEVSGLSTKRFYEAFFDATGTSPKDHVLQSKVVRARELLEDSSRSVTDVAHQLGFSSSQYFAAVFRRYVGASPTSYRATAPTAKP